MSWDRLAAAVELPFASDLVVPECTSIRSTCRRHRSRRHRGSSLRSCLTTFRDTAAPGMTIAVGAGSRGSTGRVDLLRGTIGALRVLG